MKTSAALLFSAGLVSAVNIATPVVQGGTAVNVNGISNSSQDINQGLDLSNINLGDFNLGSVNLNNQQDIINAILQMQAGLCLNNVFDANSLLGLGAGNDLQLFLQLAELMQLQQLGFLNVGGIQSLFNSGLVLSNFGGFGNGFGNIGSAFNLGVFKREVAKAKATMKRTRLRRSSVTPRQTNCQAAQIGNPAVVGSSAAATAAPAEATAAPATPATAVAAAPAEATAVAPAVAAPPPAQAVPAEAAPAVAAPPAQQTENLSDFTR